MLAVNANVDGIGFDVTIEKTISFPLWDAVPVNTLASVNEITSPDLYVKESFKGH